MLEHLLTLVLTIKNIAYYTIVFSYTTGQIIVFGLKTCLDILSIIFGTIWSGTKVLGEDFMVFIADVSARLGSVLLTLVHMIELVAHGISEFVSILHSAILGTSDAIASVQECLVQFGVKVLTCVTNVFATIKYFIVLLGSGVWFTVTFIPLSIVYMCITLTYSIGRFFEEILTVIIAIFNNSGLILYNVYEFVTDVPAESFAGLLIGFCLMYVLIKFQMLVYKSLRKLYKNVSRSVKNYFRKETPDSPDVRMNKNGSCVICFERNKCLLTMPCRHLCMCEECWERLQNYQGGGESRNCPICRRCVQYTIHVY